MDVRIDVFWKSPGSQGLVSYPLTDLICVDVTKSLPLVRSRVGTGLWVRQRRTVIKLLPRLESDVGQIIRYVKM